MKQKNPAKGSSIKTTLIKLVCYLDPASKDSAVVFDAIPEELKNISYSVAYHLLVDASNPASAPCVQAMAEQCTAVGWNRYWVRKALDFDAAQEAEKEDASNQATLSQDGADEIAQQRIDASVQAAKEAGVTQLPCVEWNGQLFAGADAVEQLVDALIAKK